MDFLSAFVYNKVSGFAGTAVCKQQNAFTVPEESDDSPVSNKEDSIYVCF